MEDQRDARNPYRQYVRMPSAPKPPKICLKGLRRDCTGITASPFSTPVQEYSDFLYQPLRYDPSPTNSYLGNPSSSYNSSTRISSQPGSREYSYSRYTTHQQPSTDRSTIDHHPNLYHRDEQMQARRKSTNETEGSGKYEPSRLESSAECDREVTYIHEGKQIGKQSRERSVSKDSTIWSANKKRKRYRSRSRLSPSKRIRHFSNTNERIVNRRSSSSSMDHERCRSPITRKVHVKDRLGRDKVDTPYPSRLLECKGKIVYIEKRLNCGVLKLQGADQRNANCLFLFKDTYLKDKSADQLQLGNVLNTNASFVSSQNNIPYIAVTVWEIGIEIPESEKGKIFNNPYLDNTGEYKRLSNILGKKMENINCKERNEREVIDILEIDKDEDNVQVIATSSDDCVVISEKKEEKTTSKFHDRNHNRSSQTRKLSQNCKESRKTKGIIKQYFNDEFGTIEVTNGERQRFVYFHFNQVWIESSHLELSLMKEACPTNMLNQMFPVGDDVCVSYTKVSLDGKTFKYHAKAVWKDESHSPVTLNANELIQNLKYQQSVLGYLLTRDASCLSVNPFPEKFEIYDGEVIDYFTEEVGFIKIRQAIAIFHLNEVWRKKEDWDLLKKNNSEMIKDVFPIGEKVKLLVRKLHDNMSFQCRYQALAVWKKDGGLSPLDPFKDLLKGNEKRFVFHKELDEQLNKFKKLACLYLDPWNSTFPLVHVVLNELPPGWTAKIVKVLNATDALIKVKMSLSRYSTCKEFYVLCHIEDIFDQSGSPVVFRNINLKDLTSCYVDLTARSISGQLSPDALLTFMDNLVIKREWKDKPLLQAIFVQLKDKSSGLSNAIPKPALLKTFPGNFHSNRKSFYYLNYLLKSKLDIKLYSYLQCSNSLDCFSRHLNPYWTAVDKTLEKELLQKASVLDTNHSSNLVYGNILSHPLWKVEESDTVISELSSIYCSPLYLYRNGFSSTSGLVEFVLPSSKKKCYAFLELNALEFFTQENRSRINDLAKIIPVNSAHLFRANLKLWNIAHQIPYYVTCIWNENSRIVNKAKIPQKKFFLTEYHIITSLKRIISEHASDIEVMEEISTSRVKASHITKEQCTKLSAHNKIQGPMKMREDSSECTAASTSGSPKYVPTNEVAHSQLLDNDGKLVTKMTNCTGRVEKVLNKNYAVLQYLYNDTKLIRIICSVLDLVKAPCISYEDYISSGKIDSLDEILFPDTRVKFNAVLISEGHYHISYACTCLTWDSGCSDDFELPFNTIQSADDLEPEWKNKIIRIVSYLDSNLKISEDRALEWMKVIDDFPSLKLSPKNEICWFNKSLANKKAEREKLHRGSNSKIETHKIHDKIENMSPVDVKKESDRAQFHEHISNAFGQVYKILQNKYAVAIVGGRLSNDKFGLVKVIFDEFDVRGAGVSDSLQSGLSEILNIGSFIMTTALQVESKDAEYFLATSVKIVKERDNTCENSLSNVSTDAKAVGSVKISNFRIVRRLLNACPTLHMEQDMIESFTLNFNKKTQYDVQDASNLNCKENKSLMYESELDLYKPSTSLIDSNNKDATTDLVEVGNLKICKMEEEINILPDILTGQSGAIVKVLNKALIIKFGLFDINEDPLNCFAVMFAENVLCSGRTPKYNVGDLVNFNGTYIQSRNSINVYLASSLRAEKDHKFDDDDTISLFSVTTNKSGFRERKPITERKEKALDIIQELEEEDKCFPFFLKNCSGKVLKTVLSSNSDLFLLLVKIEKFKNPIYALYITELKPDFKEQQKVYMNVYYMKSQSVIKYLITEVWIKGKEYSLAARYGRSLSPELASSFQNSIAYAEEVLFLASLISEASVKSCRRVVQILKKLTLVQFKEIILAYINMINSSIEIEDFTSVKRVKAPFALEKISKEAKVDIESEELLEFLILIQRETLFTKSPGYLQFFPISVIQTIRNFGIQSVHSHFFLVNDQECKNVIPTSYIDQATCMAWEEIITPPTNGMPIGWSTSNDTDILNFCFKNDILRQRKFHDKKQWEDLNGLLPSLDNLIDNEDVFSFLTERVQYLRKMIIFRGRFLVETNINTEFMSCDSDLYPKFKNRTKNKSKAKTGNAGKIRNRAHRLAEERQEYYNKEYQICNLEILRSRKKV